MPDKPLSLQDIQWREVFLFTRIFRAFRIAIRPSKMLLALAALVCMYLGGRFLDVIWRFAEGQKAQDLPSPFLDFIEGQAESFDVVVKGVIGGNWTYPNGVPGGVANFVLLNPVYVWQTHPVFFTFLFAWFLVVWAVFGGAISRIAALHVARDEVISPFRAMRFSLRALPSFIAAPLIPLIMVLIFGAVVGLLGLPLYVPSIGSIVTSLLLILAILIGALMMFLVVGSVAGFGLMYPTIAVEGSDAFDAVSRSLSHVFAAPWRLLFYTAVAVFYGTISYLFVRICLFVLLVLVHFFIQVFVFGQGAQTWASMWPTPDMAKLSYMPDWAALGVPESLAAGVTAFWVYLIIGLLGAYVISFYFSANTIIYMLMRRKVDATEMDAVYLDADDLETAEPQPPTQPAPASPTPPAPPAPSAPSAAESPAVPAPAPAPPAAVPLAGEKPTTASDTTPPPPQA